MAAKPGLYLNDVKLEIVNGTGANLNSLRHQTNLSQGRIVEIHIEEDNSLVERLHLKYRTVLPGFLGDALFLIYDKTTHPFYEAEILSKNFFEAYLSCPMIFDRNTLIGQKIDSETLRPVNDTGEYRIEKIVAFDKKLTKENRKELRKGILEVKDISKIAEAAYQQARKDMTVSQERIAAALGIQI